MHEDNEDCFVKGKQGYNRMKWLGLRKTT